MPVSARPDTSNHNLSARVGQARHYDSQRSQSVSSRQDTSNHKLSASVGQARHYDSQRSLPVSARPDTSTNSSSHEPGEIQMGAKQALVSIAKVPTEIASLLSMCRFDLARSRAPPMMPHRRLSRGCHCRLHRPPPARAAVLAAPSRPPRSYPLVHACGHRLAHGKTLGAGMMMYSLPCHPDQLPQRPAS